MVFYGEIGDSGIIMMCVNDFKEVCGIVYVNVMVDVKFCVMMLVELSGGKLGEVLKIVVVVESGD